MGKHVLQFLCHGSNDKKEHFNDHEDYQTTPMSNFIDNVSIYNNPEILSIQSKQYSGVIVDHSTSIGKARGLLFGHGADRQSDEIANTVINKLKEIKDNKDNTDDSLDVNIYGLSRGGIVGILALKKINDKLNSDPDGNVLRLKLNANIVLSDPVPGNWHSTQKLDFINNSLVNRTTDLSECNFIKKAEVFITAAGNSIEGPLDAHTPILPKFNNDTKCNLTLVDGMHATCERIYCEEDQDQKKFYLSDSASKIYERVKSTFGFSQKEDAQINLATGTTFNTINRNNQNIINDETDKFRTVFTKNGTVNLVPNYIPRTYGGGLKRDYCNGVYNNFSVEKLDTKDEYVLNYSRNAEDHHNNSELITQRRLMSMINTRGEDDKKIKSSIREHINKSLNQGTTIEKPNFIIMIKKLCENTGLFTDSSTAQKLVDGLNQSEYQLELRNYLNLSNDINKMTQGDLRKALSNEAEFNNNKLCKNLTAKKQYFMPIFNQNDENVQSGNFGSNL